MSGVILAYNPRGGKKIKSKKKGPKPMAKKRRKNPRRRKAVAKKVYRRTKSAFGGVNLGQVLKGQPQQVAGIFAAKFGANKMSDMGGDHEDWDMKAYLGAGIGAYLGGVLANAIKPGKGQAVANAGIGYAIFKAVRNELIPKSEFAMNQLGDQAEDTIHPDYMGMGDDYGEDEYYDAPGDVLLGEGGEADYMMTEGGWRAMDESDRMMGSAIVPATAELGSQVVEATAEMGGGDPYQKAWFSEDPYQEAWFNG